LHDIKYPYEKVKQFIQRRDLLMKETVTVKELLIHKHDEKIVLRKKTKLKFHDEVKP